MTPKLIVDRSPGRSLVLWSLTAMTLAAVIVIVVTAIVFRISTGVALWDALDEGDPAITDAVKIGLTSAAGIGAAVALVVAFRRQRILEEDREGQRIERRALHERYQDATAQLGHEDHTMRLAGVYALAAVADDWLELANAGQAQVCVDVFCAYVRTPADMSAATGPRPDLGVRETITRVITQHLQPEAFPSWRDFDFDFTGTTFDFNPSFHGATFAGNNVSFRNSNFTSAVSFQDVNFRGRGVDFTGAVFCGEFATFFEATFAANSISFYEARFTSGDVTFADSSFTSPQTTFGETHFEGAEVYFNGARFPASDVSFIGAEITGGRVSFDWAKFTGADLFFTRVHFTGGVMSFMEAEFLGGKLVFAEATPKDGGGRVRGPWPAAPSSLPSVWPPPDEPPSDRHV